MFDIEKFSLEYWALARRHAYRMTGSLLDAEDVVQETMLRALESGGEMDAVDDLDEWLHAAAAEAALALLRGHGPLPLDTFDLPDPVQTTGAGGDAGTRPVEDGPGWPGVALDFLFPLQYMTPEQRAVLVLRDGLEDGDRVAAAVLGMTLPEVFALARAAEEMRGKIRKRWGRTVPFAPLRDDPASARVFGRFVEALGMRDRALLQGLLWAEAELAVGGERRSGRDFVAGACGEILARLDGELRFTPVWLNGCRGALVWCWRDRGEWLRAAAVTVLCNEREVRTLKWWLDGHLLRSIAAEEPGAAP